MKRARNAGFSFHPALERPRQRTRRGAVPYNRRVAAIFRKARAGRGITSREFKIAAAGKDRADVASALVNQGYSRGDARKMAQRARGSDFDSMLRDALRRNPMSKKTKKKKRNRPRKGVMPAALKAYWAKRRKKAKNPKRKTRRPKKMRNAKRPRVITKIRRVVVTKVRRVFAKNPKPVTCPVRLTPSEQKKHAAWISRNFKRK
jgi:hypothetical protein